MTVATTPTMTSKMRQYLNDRGISDASIVEYGLYQSGLFHDGPSIHIPVENMERIYTPNPPEGTPKIKWADEVRNNNVIPPFPSWDAFKNADILCEGEFDCIVLRQHGYLAATTTAGVQGWRDEWIETLTKPVTLVFDHDEPGRLGYLGGKNSKGTLLVGLASRLRVPVRLLYWPVDKPDGYDVTDFFLEETKEQFNVLLAEAKPYLPTPETPTPEVPLVALPEDPGTEQALIGTLLLGGLTTFALVNAVVRVEDFRQEQYRLSFEAMRSLAERAEAINYRTVTTEANLILSSRGQPPQRIDVDLVETLAQVPSHHGAETYAKQLRLLGVKRKLLAVAQQLSAIAYGTGGHRTDEALVSAAQSEFDKLLTLHASGVHILTPEKYAAEYSDVLLKREKRDPEYIGYSTGFAPLDEFVAYRKGEFWLVAAAPSVGKTTILKNFQDSLAERGIPSLLASVEQPAIQLWDRSVAADARVDSWRITRGMMSESEWGKVWTSVGVRAKQPAYLYEDGSMTTATLGAALHIAKAKYGIKVCFVDYIQILRDDHSGDDEVHRVGYISGRLAMLARQLNITIVAASQLSRAYSKRPKGSLPELTDLRETGQLEQDAFIVLGLARDAQKTRLEAELGILKNRNGESGMSFRLRFDPEYTRFALEGDGIKEDEDGSA